LLAVTHLVPTMETGEVYTSGSEEGDGRLGLGPDQGPNEGGGLTVWERGANRVPKKFSFFFAKI